MGRILRFGPVADGRAHRLAGSRTGEGETHGRFFFKKNFRGFLRSRAMLGQDHLQLLPLARIELKRPLSEPADAFGIMLFTQANDQRAAGTIPLFQSDLKPITRA